MARRIWKDRIVERPRTFTVQNNPDGTITLIPAPGQVAQEGTPINAANLNGLEDDLESHLADLLQHMFGMSGYYKVTAFDTPSAGDITETVKKSSDNSTFATLVTQFDVPTAGAITKTLNCSSLGINRKIVTEFDTPSVGNIKQTVMEVV